MKENRWYIPLRHFEFCYNLHFQSIFSKLFQSCLFHATYIHVRNQGRISKVLNVLQIFKLLSQPGYFLNQCNAMIFRQCLPSRKKQEMIDVSDLYLSY